MEAYIIHNVDLLWQTQDLGIVFVIFRTNGGFRSAALRGSRVVEGEFNVRLTM
jgi:hypothetical protein